MGIFRSLECHGSFQGRSRVVSDFSKLYIEGPAECKDAGDHWPKLRPGMRGIMQATQATEASWIGDTFCLQPPLFPRRHQLHQLASFLKVPTSFEDEDDAASKVADDEVPRPPDSPPEPWFIAIKLATLTGSPEVEQSREVSNQACL